MIPHWRDRGGYLKTTICTRFQYKNTVLWRERVYVNILGNPQIEKILKKYFIFGEICASIVILGSCVKKTDLDITGKIDIISTVGKIGKAGRNG